MFKTTGLELSQDGTQIQVSWQLVEYSKISHGLAFQRTYGPQEKYTAIESCLMMGRRRILTSLPIQDMEPHSSSVFFLIFPIASAHECVYEHSVQGNPGSQQDQLALW